MVAAGWSVMRCGASPGVRRPLLRSGPAGTPAVIGSGRQLRSSGDARTVPAPSAWMPRLLWPEQQQTLLSSGQPRTWGALAGPSGASAWTADGTGQALAPAGTVRARFDRAPQVRRAE